jgi:hypothetical protein
MESQKLVLVVEVPKHREEYMRKVLAREGATLVASGEKQSRES